jgi:hypothetical protein
MEKVCWICHGLRVEEGELSKREARARIEAEEMHTCR